MRTTAKEHSYLPPTTTTAAIATIAPTEMPLGEEEPPGCKA